MEDMELLCRIIAERLARYSEASLEKQLSAVKDAIEILEYVAFLEEKGSSG